MLIIGYGNDLRGDDAAGRLAARAVADLGLPGVTVREAVQLTPELALELVGADRVVFVDASIASVETVVTPVVEFDDVRVPLTHSSTPAELLRYGATLGAVPAKAYLVSIPATGFKLGSEPSENTLKGIVKAVELIRGLIDSPGV